MKPTRLTFTQLKAREGKTVRHSVRPRLYCIVSCTRDNRPGPELNDGGYVTVVSGPEPNDGGYITVVSVSFEDAEPVVYRISECGEVIGYGKTNYFTDLDDPAYKDDHGFRLPEPPAPTGFIGPIPQGLERNANGVCLTYNVPAQPFVHRRATAPLRERVRRPARYNPFDTGAGRRDGWDS